MSVPRSIVTAILLLTFWLAGCGIPAGALMLVQVQLYSGDGVIQTCSNLIGGGYRIDFPEFDASRPYSASYRISRVPQVFDRDPVIYLKFYSDDVTAVNEDQIKPRITASFRMTLVDAAGSVVTSAELPLAKTIWWGTGNVYGAYDLDKSRFRFSRNVSYTLQVSYEPGQVPPPTQRLYFSVDNCAFY